MDAVELLRVNIRADYFDNILCSYNTILHN